MSKNYEEQQVSVRVKIAGLWTSMMFLFAYVDIFSFYREDVLTGALNGTVADFEINQTFLLLTTVFILIPSLMIFLSLVMKARVNRIVNIVVAAMYILAIIGAAVGDEWHYYLLGSVFEVALLVVLIRYAVKWPTQKK